MPYPNHNDARFRFHDKLICNILHTMLAERRTDISPTEICKAAAISRTTFYAHYNRKDVIEQYETGLTAKFFEALPTASLNKESTFILLLRFVRNERGYFAATIPNANYWLLKSILENLYPVLRTKDCGAKTYECYVMQQIALVSCWAQHEDFAFEKIRLYAHRMAQVPMMRVEI